MCAGPVFSLLFFSLSCCVFLSCDISTVTVLIRGSRELPCCFFCLAICVCTAKEHVSDHLHALHYHLILSHGSRLSQHVPTPSAARQSGCAGDVCGSGCWRRGHGCHNGTTVLCSRSCRRPLLLLLRAWPTEPAVHLATRRPTPASGIAATSSQPAIALSGLCCVKAARSPPRKVSLTASWANSPTTPARLQQKEKAL